MNILVYGAGPLGSLFASRLCEAGHQVSLLARGQRLADLREHGLVIVDAITSTETITRPQIVDSLMPEDAYDLVLVIMRKNCALEILPILAANRHTPNVLFLMNNAAGPGELVEALGRERVMIGFPLAGGYRRDGKVFAMAGARPGEKALIPIGEPDGTITPRLREAAAVLESMAGFGVELRTDMDAWLKTHVALLMPSLAAALRGAGNDNLRLAHTRDLIVLALRAVRESFQVLGALGVPITPAKAKVYAWLPEPLIVGAFQKRLVDPLVRIALVEHAEAAKDEVQFLADEFRSLARQAGVPTPACDRLYAYFDSQTPLMPEGSAEIPLDWRSLAAALLAVGAALGLAGLLVKRRST